LSQDIFEKLSDHFPLLADISLWNLFKLLIDQISTMV
jgi:hypothetical protein